jgi:hypothetical protein
MMIRASSTTAALAAESAGQLRYVSRSGAKTAFDNVSHVTFSGAFG